MQPATGEPRDHLTADQVRDLIVTQGVGVRGGLEVLDHDRGFVDDVSDALRAGSVSRDVDAKVHGSLSVDVAQELDWPRILLAPYMVLSHGGVEARFDLGAYVPQIPEQPTGQTPALFEVEADDITARAEVPMLDSVEVDDATEVIAKVRDLLDAAGLDHSIDSEAAGKTFDRPKVWPWSEEATTLDVCNELLAAVGYRRLWSDWRGRVRSQSAVPAADRAVEWLYDAGDELLGIVDHATGLAPQRRAPNRWVFVVGDPERLLIEEGDGQYTVDNVDQGPTSQDARGGWVIPQVVQLDVVDHDSLVRQGDEHVERALRDAERVSAPTGPMPLTWHRDVVRLIHPVLGDRKLLVTGWSLDLISGRMEQDWRRA